MKGSVIFASGLVEIMESMESRMSETPDGISSPVDLHVHTIYSDGGFTPEAAVMKALSRGVDVLAIADHDTLDGKDEIVEALTLAGISTPLAIELNCVGIEDRNVDILGYCIDVKNRHLIARLAEVKKNRRERIEKMIRKFNEFFAFAGAAPQGNGSRGIAVCLDDVLRYSPNQNLMGSHIAAHFAELLDAIKLEDSAGYARLTGKVLEVLRQDAMRRAEVNGIAWEEYRAGSGVPYLEENVSPDDVHWWTLTIKCLLGHDRYGNPLPCDVPKRDDKKKGLTAEEAVKLIVRAGGLPFIAHPLASLRDIEQLTEYLDELEPLGLVGLEAWSSKHTPEQARMLKMLARIRELYASAGSDSHGARGKAQIGTVTGPFPRR